MTANKPDAGDSPQLAPDPQRYALTAGTGTPPHPPPGPTSGRVRLAPTEAVAVSRQTPTPPPPPAQKSAAGRRPRPLSVPAVAAAAGLHPVYAMRVFRKYSGMTIQDAIIQHRISHAQRLMATTDDKTLTIAMQSGFGSVCRFYQAFKRITGQTPRACANSLRGKA